MSQLDNVLRRSIAHLHPSDPMGRERVFASAREAMIRLLRVYDPPLTSFEIDSKIREFDDIVDTIEAELAWARPFMLPPPAAVAADATGTLTRERPPMVPPSSRRVLPGPVYPDVEAEPEVEIEPPPPADDDDYDDYLDDDYEDIEPDDYPEDDDLYDAGYGPLDRLMDFVDRISWRIVAAAVVAILLAGGIGVLFLHGRTPSGEASPAAEVAAAPTPAAAPQEPEPSQRPAAATPTSAEPQTPAASDANAGGLALETMVLFDGRDPSVFQSAPDNPVAFQGDEQGGFARVSSSTSSTGARVEVGRGVYERIAGHRIRIVLVARGSRLAPATSLRFAYQNGRVQSPWTDVAVAGQYTPLSAIWQAPKDRGGPEFDSIIIEPGVPGDGTSVDIRSVRIEVLG